MRKKESLWELDFYLKNVLRRIIVDSSTYNEVIKSYNLNETDVNLENQLKNLVKEGMASPDKTGVYRSAIEYGGTDYKGLSESVALQAVEFEGLIALALLGEKEIVPKLRDALRKDQSKNIKRQIVAEMALQYVESGEIPTPSDEKSAVPKHLVEILHFQSLPSHFRTVSNRKSILSSLPNWSGCNVGLYHIMKQLWLLDP